jgi:hypothetical protein
MRKRDSLLCWRERGRKGTQTNKQKKKKVENERTSLQTRFDIKTHHKKQFQQGSQTPRARSREKKREKKREAVGIVFYFAPRLNIEI